MMHIAVGIASFLILLIVASGATCWTIALLKLVAAIPLAPQPLSQAAARLLAGLGYDPTAPLIAWSPRRPVPWGLVDLVGTLALYFVAILAVRLLLGQIGWLPDVSLQADDTKLSLSDKSLLVWANVVVSCGLIAVSGPLIALRTGALWRDFGVSVRDLWNDMQLGLNGFVMLAPPSTVLPMSWYCLFGSSVCTMAFSTDDRYARNIVTPFASGPPVAPSTV